MATLQNVYLDTNAIIRFAESEDDDITSLVFRASEREIRLFTSELTLAEVLVVPIREGDEELVIAYKTSLRSDATLTVVPVDRSVLERSAELRARYGGKALNSIHCATAELSGCRVVVSSDKRFRLPDGMTRIGVEDAGKIGI